MNTNTGSAKTLELLEKFEIYCPGGSVNINQGKADSLIIVDRAQGARIWGLDGNEYLDYASAYGPNILGHRHPEYIQALYELIDRSALCSSAFFAITERYIGAVEKIIQHIPCAERVKFTTSGSEAVQAAMRIARSYTRRPYVLTFQDHYHGWIDNVDGLNIAPRTKDKRPVAQSSENASLGRGECAKEETLMIEWNNLEVLENTLAKYGDEIAMILTEPFASNAGARFPRPGYLKQVRKRCDQYGIVLCFDEVLTGFRVGLNGAQGLFGVTPDLSTLGKALGGGVPIAAVVGQAKFMDVLADGKTRCYGTYWGNSLSVQGADAALGILGRDNGAVYAEMERVQKALMSGLDEIARRRGIPMRVQGLTGLFSTLFGVDPDRVQYSNEDAKGMDYKMASKFSELIKLEGISSATARWLPSIVHTDKDTAVALEAADRAMAKL